MPKKPAPWPPEIGQYVRVPRAQGSLGTRVSVGKVVEIAKWNDTSPERIPYKVEMTYLGKVARSWFQLQHLQRSGSREPRIVLK